VCGTTYDCTAGVCDPQTVNGAQQVCIPGIQECWSRSVIDSCIGATIAFCELVQSCGASNSSSIPARYKTDFNYCVATECSGAMTYTAAECTQHGNFILAGSAPCP
jgi:hypothetical protein